MAGIGSSAYPDEGHGHVAYQSKPDFVHHAEGGYRLAVDAWACRTNGIDCGRSDESSMSLLVNENGQGSLSDDAVASLMLVLLF